MDALADLAPLIAALASAVGLMVAIDQLTLRSRMRRIAEWSKELAGGEPDRGRADVLHSMRRWATGHVVASVMAPARLFVSAALWTISTLWMIVTTGIDADAGGWFRGFVVGAGLLVLTISYRPWVAPAASLRRVWCSSRAGRSPSSATPLWAGSFPCAV